MTWIGCANTSSILEGGIDMEEKEMESIFDELGERFDEEKHKESEERYRKLLNRFDMA